MQIDAFAPYMLQSNYSMSLPMSQEPSFVFGSSYCAFFGASSKNGFHQGMAFQIIISKTSLVTVIGENDEAHVGKIILIKPSTVSKICPDEPVTHLYLSPTIDFTLDLMDVLGDDSIHVLSSSEHIPFNSESTDAEIIAALDKLDQISTDRLDPRLVDVLDDLNQNLDSPSILDAAQRCGLSRSRVRTLAREQLGIPLSTWVTWRKLVLANKALSVGANLTEAALVGHFSDQAHFSRTMKKMFGVTPTVAVLAYTE